MSMFLWMSLHLIGVLHIDSADFMKWNLWLSYFAGTQASIVLMSSERQAIMDRKRQEFAIKLEQSTNKLAEHNNQKVEMLSKQIEELEEILEDMIGEVEEKNGAH